MKRLLTIVLVIILFACFLQGAFYHIKEAGETPHINSMNIDLYSQYLPYLTFAKQSVLEGSLPLWTPYQEVGRPFFGIHGIGLLYPINWTVFLFDVPKAMLIIQFLNILVGMAGMSLYLRHLELDWAAILLGSLLFGVALLTPSFHGCIGATYCWLPVIFWLTHRLIDRPEFGRCAALSAGLTLCFFGGFLQHFYYTGIILFIYLSCVLIFRWREYGPRAVLLRMSLAGLAFVLVVGLICVQLLPSMELSLHSVRDVTTQAPATETAGYRHSLFVAVTTQFKAVTSHLKPGAFLLLIPFAFGSRRHRSVAIALLIALVFIILFLASKHVPAMAFFWKISVSSIFRWHVRILNLSDFILIALAAIGLSSLWDKAPLKVWDHQRGKPDWHWILVLISVIALSYPVLSDIARFVSRSSMYLIIFLPCFLTVSIFCLYSWQNPSAVKKFGALGVAILAVASIASWRADFAFVGYHALFVAFLLPTVLLLINPPVHPRWLKGSALWAVGTLILISSTSLGYIQSTVPGTTVDGTRKIFFNKRVTWIKEHAGYDRALLASPGPDMNFNAGNMSEFFNVNSYESLTLDRWMNFVRLAVGPTEFDELFRGAARTFHGMIDFPLRDFKRSFLRQPRMLGLLSLRYVASHERLDAGEFEDGWMLTHEGSDNGSEYYIYENTWALPRTYLVNGYRLSGGEEESLRAIEENASILSHSVVLEGGAPSFPSSQTPDNPGKAWISSYEANEVELRLDASEPSLAILTDSYYPGWVAFVDGVRKPILRANSLFRAVEVSPGTHTVVFKYRPLSVRLGFILSVTTLLMMVIALFIEQRTKKRATPINQPDG